MYDFNKPVLSDYNPFIRGGKKRTRNTKTKTKTRNTKTRRTKTRRTKTRRRLR
jgi:hypothetical protein